MPSNCALYISARDLPPEVLRLDPSAKVKFAGSDLEWSSAEVSLGKVRLELNRMSGPAELDDHLNGFCGYVMHCNDGKMDQATYSLIQQILRTKHVLGTTVEPSFDDRAISFIRSLRARTNALLFINDRVVDLEERVLAGPDGPEPGASLPRFASAVERKKRSEKRAKECGIPTLQSLPVIVADEEVALRSPEEIARRAVCLWAVAVRGEGLELDKARGIIEEAGLWESVTPNERAFLDEQEPTHHDRAQFAWQYECLWVLGWALGLFEDLPAPTKICNVPLLAETMIATSPEGMANTNRRRSAQEILDETDFIYRAHWAVTEARVNKRKPAPGGLESGVVLERHRALNWLISHQNADWDDVSMDT